MSRSIPAKALATDGLVRAIADSASREWPVNRITPRATERQRLTKSPTARAWSIGSPPEIVIPSIPETAAMRRQRMATDSLQPPRKG